MSEKTLPTPEEHKAEIDAYVAERPRYELYAKMLEDILRNACKASIPDAFVQSRAKRVSSFAEKTIRQYSDYPNAAKQMTDLCGARVIVQTAAQVKAVGCFIEDNFEVLEKQDKALSPNPEDFRCRDTQYVVQLREDRLAALGVSEDQYKEIGKRKSEIQVRTWLEHTWADSLADRIRKNKLKLSSDVVRAGTLLAALVEETERSIGQLTDELDGLIANYTAHTSKAEIEREITILTLLLENEREKDKQASISTKLARLYAASGNHERVVELLEHHIDHASKSDRCELLLDLGYNLCRLHHSLPDSPQYQRGLVLLRESIALCECERVSFVPHLRKRESLHARALVRLGSALEEVTGKEHEARRCYEQSHEHEPGNPYHLSEMFTYEAICGHGADLSPAMRSTIRAAIGACEEHAKASLELPYAFLTAGRLSLFLDKDYDALGWYARAVGYCQDESRCVPPGQLSEEMRRLLLLSRGSQQHKGYQRVVKLLRLVLSMDGRPGTGQLSVRPPVVIVTGGAGNVGPGVLARALPLLESGLSDFDGTVISGGTTAGIPGTVGGVAEALGNKKRFQLFGYLPTRMPHGVSEHRGYDRTFRIGDDFWPEQILQNWEDVLAAGIDPRDVLLVGFGGGSLSAVEYRVALGFGASVGIVMDTGGSADALLADPVWASLPNLFPLPVDASTVRGFLIPGHRDFEPPVCEEMARSFHSQYVANSSGKLPPTLRPWEKLSETYRRANLEQARYAIEILEAAGFEVREAVETPVVFEGFTEGEVEQMAEMEHGRWNVERLRDGWRPGPERDEARKVHNYLVPWRDLPEHIKPYDRDSVRAFPRILAQAGLEVRRSERTGGEEE